MAIPEGSSGYRFEGFERAEQVVMIGSGPEDAGPGLFMFAGNPVPRWAAYLQSVLFIAIGIAVLIGGIRRYDAVQPIAGGRTTIGTVVAVNTGQSCGRHGCSTHWVPTVQFTRMATTSPSLVPNPATR